MHDAILESRDHPDLDALLRGWLAAALTADLPALQRLSAPHPQLARLLARPLSPEQRDQRLAELPRATWRAMALADDRLLAHVWFLHQLFVLPLVRVGEAWRVDARYQIAATEPDDELRAAARTFFAALLLSDVPAMQEASFDPRGVEVLGGRTVAACDRWDLDLQAAGIAFTELAEGELYPTATGPQPVTARHREHGIRVLLGLGLDGEIPFQLRQKDGVWKVIPFLFVQAEAMRRGATFGPSGAS